MNHLKRVSVSLIVAACAASTSLSAASISDIVLLYIKTKKPLSKRAIKL